MPRNNSTFLYRGSYISAHVLSILLNELGKRDKMRGLTSILSLFCNSFNKGTDIRLYLSYDCDVEYSLKFHFWCKEVVIASLVVTGVMIC